MRRTLARVGVVATLTITTGVGGSWFAAAAAPALMRVPIDFDGDQITDFAVARNTGGGAFGALTWFWINSLGISAAAWGIQGDQLLPGDYDGDGRDDVAVWRSGTPSVFYIRRSSDLSVMAFPFGVSIDDPNVFGDWDGDLRVDPAVYREGVTAGQPSYWYVWRSATSTLLSQQWGQGGDNPARGDFDGDGRRDFAVRRNAGGGIAVYYLLCSTIGPQAVPWGTTSDQIVTGDYDGDGRTDLAVARGVSGTLTWYIRRSSDGGLTAAAFGLSSIDIVAPGDYNGDGRTDVAVWRATPAPATFYVLLSGSLTVLTFPWGLISDRPLATFNVH